MKFCFFLVLIVVAITLAAQTASEVAITAEPHHHLALANKYVRVFKVDLPSQQATLMHRHDYDYAEVTIGATELLNQAEGKPPANLKLQDGETRFSPGPFAHLIRNLAPTPFRNITVEFLPTSPAKSASAQWADDRGLQVLNGGTEEILFVKDGVRASDVQLNAAGTLPKTQAAAAELIVAVTDAHLQAAPGHHQQNAIHLLAGEIRWLQPARTLVNAGKQSMRFICFEFH